MTVSLFFCSLFVHLLYIVHDSHSILRLLTDMLILLVVSSEIRLPLYMCLVWFPCEQMGQLSLTSDVVLSPFLTGRMFVRRTYFGHFDEL